MSLPHGGNIYHYAKKYGIPEGDFLDFSASINPLGPSPRAVKALRDAIPSLVNYPDPGSGILTSAITEKFGIPEQSILAGNGSTELIYLIPRALRPRRALLPVPSFTDYDRALRLAGCVNTHFPLLEAEGFAPDVDRLVKAMSGQDMLFLCNPNNPTGVLLDRDAVQYILKAAKRSKTFVVLDEAFIEYAPGRSALDFAATHRGVAVLRNFTKFYGMPGLRAGWLAAHPDVVKKLAASREPWSVNTLAERAAAASLADSAYEKKSLALVDAEKEFLFAGLSRIPGISPYPPSVNFVFARLDYPGADADTLAESLASKGILIRSCGNFRGLDRRFVRLAVRSRSDNEALLAALRPALADTL
ncbi:MAG: threonine-phosphate decarboxylase [Nitrospirae bacterium]|nr:threonine-phosphate decarboxylase [Nitrospirota bacterium]